jgi:hypothetical protein
MSLMVKRVSPVLPGTSRLRGRCELRLRLRGEIADRGMPPLPVVQTFDLSEQISSGHLASQIVQWPG